MKKIYSPGGIWTRKLANFTLEKQWKQIEEE